MNKEISTFYRLTGYLESVVENEYNTRSEEQIKLANELLDYIEKSLKQES